MKFKNAGLWMAKRCTGLSGSWWSGLTASLLVALWIVGGFFNNFSEGYQELLDFVTSTVPFVMVFFIQHAQNCESKALHMKLDELILKQKSADNTLIRSEELTEEELNALQQKYKELADKVKNKKECCGC